MPIQLEEDKATLDAAAALLVSLAKNRITAQQWNNTEVPDDVEKAANALLRAAYRNADVEKSIDGFTFWGIVDWALLRYFEKWIAKPDRNSAADLLRLITANLQREMRPKLAIVPVRKTRVGVPTKIGSLFFVPPQETENQFINTLNSLGFNLQKIRDGLFDHMTVTTGYNLTHRPLVIMPTNRNQYSLQEEFRDTFTNKALPVLRVFDVQFPSQGPPATLEIMSTLLSDRIFSGVILELESGEMQRQGLDRMGGELSIGVNLSPDRLKEFSSHGFDQVLAWVNTSTGKLSGRVHNALSFFNRARDAEIQHDDLGAFIASVISLEALFSRDSGMPLRATLADSVALLTESALDARLGVAKRMRELYDRRSEIVHAGNHSVETDDLCDAMVFCARSLFEILSRGPAWGDVADTALFSEVDRRKFG